MNFQLLKLVVRQNESAAMLTKLAGVPFKTACIYRLRKNGDPDFYIGATTIPLENRLRTHRNDLLKHPLQKVYACIAQRGGFSQSGRPTYDAFGIDLLAAVTYHATTELRLIERAFVRTINPSLNTASPYRTNAERLAYSRAAYATRKVKKVHA